MKSMIIIVLLLVLTLSGCIDIHRKLFSEEIYIYDGDFVEFFDELEISEIQVTLIEIDETEYMDSNMINVIQNQENSKYYSVYFEMKFTSDTDSIKYDMQYTGHSVSKRDMYYHRLYLDNSYHSIEGYIDFMLEFRELSHISHNEGVATSITFHIREWEINGVEGNELFYSFPETLNIK